MAFTLYYLGKHEDIQDKVRQEVVKVLPTDKEFNANDLEELKYLEQCIKETLRLVPSVPMISRSLTEDVLIGN